MLPESWEGCRCKGKTPKTFMCVYVCVFHPEIQNFMVRFKRRIIQRFWFFFTICISYIPRLKQTINFYDILMY